MVEILRKILNNTIKTYKFDNDSLDMSKFETPLKVSGSIEKEGNALVLKFEVLSHYKLNCYRCLEVVEDDFGFSHEEVIEDDFEEFELEKAINDEIYLQKPSRVLCKEDCCGLCPECGINLNHEECDCSEKRTNGIFDDLSDLFS